MHARARALLLALLLGLLTLATAQTVRVDCRSDEQDLKSESGIRLTDGEGRLQLCLQAVSRRLERFAGIDPSHCYE